MAPLPAPLPPSSRQRPTWQWVAAVVVLLLGISLRFAFYDAPRGYPDEEITVEVVRHMRQSGDWDVNWAKASLPPDLRYDQYNFSTHLYATFFFYRVAKWVPGTNDWRGRDGGVVVYRFLVSLLAAVSVVQTFRLGRRLGGWPTAIGATLLVGIATLLVQDAHYLRPEALTTALMLAAVLLVLPAERFQLLRALAAGVAVGLLVACKVSMLLVVWLPFVAVVSFWREIPRRAVVFGGIAVAIVLGFIAGAPGALAHPDLYVHGVSFLTQHYAGVHPPHSHLHGGAMGDVMARYFTGTLGWPAMFCFAGGVFAWVRARRWPALLAVVGPVLLFAGYFATCSVFFERNLSHVVPLFLIVVVVGALEFARMVSARLQVSYAGLVVGLFALLCVHPVELTAALVRGDYLGRGAIELEQFEAPLRAFYPQAEFWSEMLMTDEPLIRLEDQLRRSRHPVLLRVTDYADEGTKLNVQTLLRRFDSGLVADYPGLFGQLPTCTLHTYHSPRFRYYIVRGVRPPKKSAAAAR